MFRDLITFLTNNGLKDPFGCRWDSEKHKSQFDWKLESSLTNISETPGESDYIAANGRLKIFPVPKLQLTTNFFYYQSCVFH